MGRPRFIRLAVTMKDRQLVAAAISGEANCRHRRHHRCLSTHTEERPNDRTRREPAQRSASGRKSHSRRECGVTEKGGFGSFPICPADDADELIAVIDHLQPRLTLRLF
jgi:hypothetical protein